MRSDRVGKSSAQASWEIEDRKAPASRLRRIVRSPACGGTTSHPAVGATASVRDRSHAILQRVFGDPLTHCGAINIGAAEMNPCPNARIFDALRDLRKTLERSCDLLIRIGGRNAYPVGTEKVAQHRLHHARKQRMTRGILRVCRERRDQALPCGIYGRCIVAVAFGVTDGRLRTPKQDLVLVTPPDNERV